MKLSALARGAATVLAAGAVLLFTGPTAGADAPGYPPTTGTVSGHIYLDTNANGVQDHGEPNLPGVRVVVSSSGSAEPCLAATPQRVEPPQAVACPSQTVITDANGNWNAVVPAGSVTADVDETTLPPGVVHTEGTDPTTVTAIAGAIVDGGNDGYAPTATVSGHIYLDNNGNGTQDPGEPSLPGVKVIVTDSGGSVTIVTTDANGDWATAVRPGTTTATVDATTLPPGLTQTEGNGTATVNAIAGQNTFVGNNGYTRNEGTVPKTGSDSTLGGTGIGLGLVTLGGAMVIVARLRRRQLVPA